MSSYRLIEERYALPSPAGAFHAASHRNNDPVRSLLCALLQYETTPAVTQQALERWTSLSGEDAQEALYHAQSLGWVEGFREERNAPPGALETLLPELLPPLSDCGKALLADSHGFYVAASGFTHEAAIELSALSADLASLDNRHQSLTHNNLRIPTSAWALVDAAGNSQLGFWPLFIDDQRFALVLQGVPHLNQSVFTSLVWALSTRYAGSKRD
ncbi:MAG: hypothetical protein B6D72_01430 [gamma proteobacterium symbiont of Ctena orbiculata]|uniref:Peptidase M23 n=1 Tax=Candidatus Thiodiazotropha taylori TaxID=2792791 RepID=A0A944MB20_9GAMM|nr:hypothetical protein [Candidatus Thiodiazotropha taylori]MBV2097337.1 hypothetical protein [Candidatus Thiodiazotropha sp. (ex Codakia orbicularis)]PUB88140.1 MAG: hypothetical protein DBP00_06840 [gamma proteobacterium symbiont of Ctena orbiculata]MBT3027026.1 hypothetical protein [Candidatus Thiodiazotropha taylori]MBT3034660.1 hypothetical protein [Candidatus Thiodiazotropha taylori]